MVDSNIHIWGHNQLENKYKQINNMKKLMLFVAIMALVDYSAFAQTVSNKYFKDFPYQADPIRVGEKLSHHLLETKHQLYFDRGIHYAEVCTWFGALRFAQETKDSTLISLLRNRFELLFEIEKKLLPPPIHVDQNMFGCLPLRFYEVTGDKRYLKLGLPYADSQWTLPEKATAEERQWAKNGYSWQTRLWIDDMYMITILQIEAYRATGDPKYLNRAAKEMTLYLDKLQNKNGLFFHAPDVPYYWGRGDGWFAVGMTELLLSLPQNSPYRKRIFDGYLLMMNNLKKLVNKDGLWNQLIDKPDLWTETSGSAMFTYSMIVGVKHKWLQEEEFGPIARRAWLGLCNYIDDHNNLTEVCVGTGKKNSYQYYLNRPRSAGDYHGQAPMIWCATALAEE